MFSIKLYVIFLFTPNKVKGYHRTANPISLSCSMGSPPLRLKICITPYPSRLPCSKQQQLTACFAPLPAHQNLIIILSSLKLLSQAELYPKHLRQYTEVIFCCGDLTFTISYHANLACRARSITVLQSPLIHHYIIGISVHYYNFCPTFLSLLLMFHILFAHYYSLRIYLPWLS